MRVCVVYVVKEVTSFPGLGQLMGVARKRTRALQSTDKSRRKKAVALLAYVETGTNSWLFFLKYISKVLEGL